MEKSVDDDGWFQQIRYAAKTIVNAEAEQQLLLIQNKSKLKQDGNHCKQEMEKMLDYKADGNDTKKR